MAVMQGVSVGDSRSGSFRNSRGAQYGDAYTVVYSASQPTVCAVLHGVLHLLYRFVVGVFSCSGEKIW